jgi:hypothetical protein
VGKGANWDNDKALPLYKNPSKFQPIGEVHGDLLVDGTVRARGIDTKDLFAQTLTFTGELAQQDGSGNTLFAVTSGESRRILIADDNGNTTAILSKQGNLGINKISNYEQTASSSGGGGGESMPSNVEEYLQVSTPNGARLIPAVLPADTTDPAQVTNLSASDDASDTPSIELDWDDVTQDVDGNAETIDHYNVYRSGSSGGPYQLHLQPQASSTTDPNVQDGETWYYVVSAVDDAGNEGAQSAEASATALEKSGRLK